MNAFLLREATYPPGQRQQRHSHDYSNITIVLAGKIEEATEWGQYCAQPGSVVAKGAGCEHEDRVGGHGAKTLSIQFHGAAPLRTGAWRWLDTPGIVRLAMSVRRASTSSDLERSVGALIDAVATEPARHMPPEWIAPLRDSLDRDCDRSIRFDALARQFGLHPVYVSRAFRRHVGMSMSEYVRSARLRRARHVLSSTRRSVAAIAAECGFADSSHLCRTFSQLLGETPTAFRKWAQVH